MPATDQQGAESRSDQPQSFNSAAYERTVRLWDFAATSTAICTVQCRENGQSGQHGRRSVAAGDPIFWLHPLPRSTAVASCNAAGQRIVRRTVHAESFVFSDGNGKRVTAMIGDVSTSAKLK